MIICMIITLFESGPTGYHMYNKFARNMLQLCFYCRSVVYNNIIDCVHILMSKTKNWKLMTHSEQIVDFT